MTGASRAAWQARGVFEIALEPLRPEHAEPLREMRASPEVARWWHPPAPGWPLDAEPEIEKRVVLVDGVLAGYVQFYEEPDPTNRHADVDIFLGPDHMGRGLGTETMRAIVRELTEQRGHHRLTLWTSPDNPRAIRCYEKAGFRRVGVTRRSELSHVTGEWEDELFMELVL